MNVPILYLVFNRPDLVRLSFELIREQKPKYLYIAGDGPRSNHETDEIKCKEVRSYIKKNIDWNCTIRTLFRDENLGCGMAVSQAITWFFNQVEHGIILEDDCLPDRSFFKFSEELLEKYQEDKRVYQIAGSNWQKGNIRGQGDYYFSAISSVWGWATWRDRWENYKYKIDVSGSSWKKIKNNISRISSSKLETNYHLNCFEKTQKGYIDTWDYQWRYLLFLKQALSVVPNINLITNVGHREDATHTTSSEHWRANLNTGKLTFPLTHPVEVKQNKKADKFLSDHIWLAGKVKKKKSFLSNIKNMLPLPD